MGLVRPFVCFLNSFVAASYKRPLLSDSVSVISVFDLISVSVRSWAIAVVTSHIAYRLVCLFVCLSVCLVRAFYAITDMHKKRKIGINVAQ